MQIFSVKQKVKSMVRESIKPLFIFLQKHFSREFFYQNINYDPTRRQKRVLISYVTYPFSHDYGERLTHTSEVEAAIIVKAFIDIDCVIDVIRCDNCDELDKIIGKKYDYIFGFGKPWSVAADNNPHSYKIMYLTECAPSFSNMQEQSRLDYYAYRHGRKYSLTRSGHFFLDEHIKKANLGVFLGNAYTSGPYINRFPLMKLRLFAPSGFRNEKLLSCPMQGDSCSFLWFGSWGAIHKGLDILLDVFKNIPSAKLFIAGLKNEESWLLDGYRQYDNIINLGFLDVQSIRFLELVEKIPYCVLPSACEGMSTSVLTCMRHGLIPVITPSCGIDVGDFGYLIEDYHIEAVEKMVHELMHISKDELIRRRNVTFAVANEKYSLESFSANMRSLVESFVDR